MALVVAALWIAPSPALAVEDLPAAEDVAGEDDAPTDSAPWTLEGVLEGLLSPWVQCRPAPREEAVPAA
jgi:hypothetical protein